VPFARRRKKRDWSRFPHMTHGVSARVTEQVSKEIDRIVYTEGYIDVGDYIRNLIRKDFKQRGISVKMEGKKADGRS